MNRKQRASLERLKEIRYFVGHHPLPGERGRRLMAELRAQIARIEALGVGQHVSTMDRTMRSKFRARLRHALRHGQMLPLRRDAGLILKGEPGVERFLAVPHKTASDATLVAAAGRMAKGLSPYRASLVKEGFAQGFLDSLRRAAAELKANSTSSASSHARSTLDLRSELSGAHRLEGAIEGLAMRMAQADPRVWRRWLKSKRTPNRGGRPKKKRPSPGGE